MTNGKVTVLRPAKAAVPKSGKATISSGDVLDAIKTITGAVTEHRRIMQENTTAREAIRQKASLMRQQIATNRKTLNKYLDRTFDNRDLALAGLLDGLDKAIDTGNVDLASVMADRIADVVKSGPLINAVELREQQERNDPVFRIGRSDEVNVHKF